MKDESLGRLFALLLFVGLAVLYFEWSSVVRLIADDAQGDAVLWLYDSDVGPGDRVEGRVRVDGGERAGISQVKVLGAGAPQRTRGTGSWGDTINARKYDSDSAELSFEFTVPSDAEAGELGITIEVSYVLAERNGASTFGNESRQATFERTINVHGRAVAILFRLGKAVLAILLWIGVVAIEVARSRRYKREASAWLLIPFACAGWFWSTTLLEHATRLHGWWFVVLAMIAWFCALLLTDRFTRYDGFTAYTVEQAMVATTGDAPFRDADVQVPVKSPDDVEFALLSAGLMVLREKENLIVTIPKIGQALVPVPPTESFGGGPFQVHARERSIAVAILAAISPLLGELRVHSADGEFRVPQNPTQSDIARLSMRAKHASPKPMAVQPSTAAHAKSGSDEQTRACPTCGRLIHPKAKTCMHCWATVSSSA